VKRDEPERGEGARITHANRGHCNEYLCAASWPAAHAAAAAHHGHTAMLRSELLFFNVLLLNSLTQSTKAAANQTTVGPGCNYLPSFAATNHADRRFALQQLKVAGQNWCK
jgi:hypothetical protein